MDFQHQRVTFVIDFSPDVSDLSIRPHTTLLDIPGAGM
jgi:hypothetical protein